MLSWKLSSKRSITDSCCRRHRKVRTQPRAETTYKTGRDHLLSLVTLGYHPIRECTVRLVPPLSRVFSCQPIPGAWPQQPRAGAGKGPAACSSLPQEGQWPLRLRSASFPFLSLVWNGINYLSGSSCPQGPTSLVQIHLIRNLISFFSQMGKLIMERSQSSLPRRKPCRWPLV